MSLKCKYVTCIAVVLALLLTGCGVNTEEDAGERDDIQSDRETDVRDEPIGDQNEGGEVADQSADEEHIQDYEARGIIFTDKASNLIWAYAREWGGERDFITAVDEAGKMYAKIYSDRSDVLCAGEYICLFDKYLDSYNGYQIVRYDGRDVTDELLGGYEDIWRATRIGDKLYVWKYETIETYSSIKYILQVCDTDGNMLLELDSDEYPAIENALSADKYLPDQSQILHELGAGFYQIGDMYIDLTSGEIYGAEQYGLSNAVNVHDGYVFSGIECEDNHEGFLKRYKGLTVYKTGIDEPVYSWESDNEMFYSVNENGIIKTYTRGETQKIGVNGQYLELASEIEPHRYYDGFTGKLLAQYDTASLGVEAVNGFNGETAIAYMHGPGGGGFVTYVDRDGKFLFEPVPTKSLYSDAVIADWRDDLGAICVYYTGEEYDGEGLYLLDTKGDMKALHISDVDEIALVGDSKIATIQSGMFSVYNID